MARVWLRVGGRFKREGEQVGARWWVRCDVGHERLMPLSCSQREDDQEDGRG
jgi:hypothetical protein